MLKTAQQRFLTTVRPQPVRRPMANSIRLGSHVLDWERETYSADPTGGAPSRY